MSELVHVPGATDPAGRPQEHFGSASPFVVEGVQYPGYVYLSPEQIAASGATLVVRDPVPQCDPRTHRVVETIAGASITYALEALDPETVTAIRVADIAARRWAAETGGIVWSGWPVATDRDSQAKIAAAYAMARDGHWPAGGGWKGADGVWRPLSAEEVIAMAVAVAGHVQACFAREAALQADPAADIETGWPAGT